MKQPQIHAGLNEKAIISTRALKIPGNHVVR